MSVQSEMSIERRKKKKREAPTRRKETPLPLKSCQHQRSKVVLTGDAAQQVTVLVPLVLDLVLSHGGRWSGISQGQLIWCVVLTVREVRGRGAKRSKRPIGWHGEGGREGRVVTAPGV